jgi:hypothetical protein
MIYLIAILILGIAVFFMCFNIIFRKKPFPDSEIGHNRELRKRGIICAKEDEIKRWGRNKCISCEETCAIKDTLNKKQI